MNRYRERYTEKVPASGRLVYILPGLLLLIILACIFVSPSPALAQSATDATPTPEDENAPVDVPNEVKVIPTARDDEISKRLKSILESTGWFQNPEVEVKDGIVFLTGQTRTVEYKNWAEELAYNTQDVVAVVNRIELIQPSVWNFQPALNELREFGVGLIRAIPLILISLVVLLISWGIMRFGMKAARDSLSRNLDNPLLSNVGAYTVGILILLAGFYVILQIAGLTSAATAVIGGTGLVGLVVGIAFRDITENFLASIFLSVQDPFHTNDLVEIGGILGYVQALTIRVTILMTVDGTVVQIPNATVYKSNIFNYTSNPNQRADFVIGIGYEESVPEAQEIALKVLDDHLAVLKDPEPMVTVESLGSSTVNLHVYFWLNSKENSLLKVKSSVIHQVEIAFQAAGISMPDNAREVIFPEGIPVQWFKPDQEMQPYSKPTKPDRAEIAAETPSVSTEEQANLFSEAKGIQEQARLAGLSEEKRNLLKPTDPEVE